MAGAGDINHIEIARDNEPIEMHIHEIQPRRRAPVTEQAGFDVFEP